MTKQELLEKYEESQRTISELRKELEYLQNDKLLQVLQNQELKLKEESYKKFLHSNQDHLQRFIKEELSKNLRIELTPDYNSSLTIDMYLYNKLISTSETQVIDYDDPSSMGY